MWTPRRILMALTGLLVVAASYVGYSLYLGKIDGLPPLPGELLASDGPRNFGEPPRSTTLERRFEMAFGVGCRELTFPIKSDIKDKNILLATHAFRIIPSGEREGWVEMWPISLATIGKSRGAEGLPEIDTIYADKAFIKFDQPVRSMADLTGRKIMTAELHADPEADVNDPRKGRVRLLNNRRTQDLNDDIELITPGPVYYEAIPRAGKPNIYTFTEVQVFDHQNTNLPKPDWTVPRLPTMSGVGLRVHLAPEPKKDKKDAPRLPIPRKEDRPGISGVEVVGLENSVKMNLWTEGDSSFVAPNGGKKDPKEKAVAAKKGPPPEKRLLRIQTNGPFRYDLTTETAHFEKPRIPTAGLVEHVTVTRADNAGGEELLDCEFLDVKFVRRKPVAVAKKDAPPPKKDGNAEGDLEISNIHAWGETVVMTSDKDKLSATGTELIHDVDARTTILKGSAQQQVQADKDGNLLRGSELHLFGDGTQINEAHVLGAGSLGMGEVDPDTNEHKKQASWTDRLLYTRRPEGENGAMLDVFTFISKDGTKSIFRDVSTGELQQMEGYQLKVWLTPADDKKKDAAKKKDPAVAAKKGDKKEDPFKSGRPYRVEGTGAVRSTSAELVIRQSDYVNVHFKDVEKLLRPKPPKAGPVAVSKGPPPREIDPAAPPPPVMKQPREPKAAVEKMDPQVPEPPVAKKPEPKRKVPLLVTARTIEAWVNRDPAGSTEMDHVVAIGNVDIHQDPAKADETGTDIRGQVVSMQAYETGDELKVTGVPSSDPNEDQWGVVRFDKLTMFGFDIVIDQRTDQSHVKGRGHMEILSGSTMEGKKLETPTTMYVAWKQKMDFLGADKLIYYHGAVQAFQDASTVKCEWMQVILDRPVYLDETRRPKREVVKAKPGEKKVDENPKVDTVLCFHAPRDEDIPNPKTARLVEVTEETKVDQKVVKFQSVQAMEVQMVNTPLPDKKSRHDMTATASSQSPGFVRIWQAGAKDGGLDGPKETKKKDGPPKKKGELGADEEMKLTIVQFGEKMKGEDLRKRAKFWTNIRVLHLAADDPRAPVDLRQGQIPPGAIYMECAKTLEVFNTFQREKAKDGKDVDVAYQEMIAEGNCRVRKQGEFFGDADKVTYSELKDTITFHGTAQNPAIVNQQRGQGIRDKTHTGRTIIYHQKTRTFETIGATGISQ